MGEDTFDALREAMRERSDLLLDLAAGTMTLWQDAVERSCGQYFGLAWSMLGAAGALAGASERAPERLAELQREMLSAGERVGGDWVQLQKDVAELWSDASGRLSAMSIGGFEALAGPAASMLSAAEAQAGSVERGRRAPRRAAQGAIRAGSGARRSLNA